jgi:RNA polymerase sigma factor (sigma-70 family)
MHVMLCMLVKSTYDNAVEARPFEEWMRAFFAPQLYIGLNFSPMSTPAPIDNPHADSDAASTDVSLMQGYQAGDAAAFDQLYARHRTPLFRYIGRFAGPQGLTDTERDEVFQDVWMSVIETRDRYQPTAQFRTWLFTIAHHRVMDFFRARKPNVITTHDLTEESDDTLLHSTMMTQLQASRLTEPHVLAQASEQGQAILNALAALPLPQREAFLLYEEGELSVQDIADVTGITFEAAKSRLRYAYAGLREQLKGFL